jgi:pristinamycin I synthase-3/4
VTALTAALADLAGRHEALRTMFPEAGGEPRQHIVPAGQARPVLTCAAVGAAGLDQALQQATAYAFDLARELPIRAWLFQTGPQEHALLLVVHHIAADGWSLGPVGRDLSRAYAARRQGRAPRWAPLPVQYADYALWQQERLGDARQPGTLAAAQLEYWRAALEGIPDQLALPYDQPPPGGPASPAGCLSLTIDPAIRGRREELARAEGVTMFMIFHALIAVLLMKHGAGPDIPLGTPVAGRPDEALDDLAGFFINTLVLRTDLSGNPTFSELLSRVRETDLAAYHHPDIPFDSLVEHLNPARSPTRQPLFQTMLSYRTDPPALLEAPDLTLTPIKLTGITPKFDLEFITVDTTIDIMYNPARFTPATIQQLLDHLTTLLDAATADTGLSLDELCALKPRPRTAAEHLVAAVWADVTGTREIGSYDDFFELGGDLIAARLAAGRLGQVFHVRVPVRLIIDDPTVARLAARLSGLTRTEAGTLAIGARNE